MEKQELWQVHVELGTGKRIPVGPRMVKPMAEDFAVAIRAQIALGREKVWRDPQVLPARPNGAVVH
jgi:hypothetical protein